jgi:large subunit ribosomal protein L5
MKSVFGQNYNENIRPALMKDMGYNNVHQVPKLSKIVLNMGMGRRLAEKSVMEAAIYSMESLSGQHPAIMKAKNSNASFKVREGMPLGLKVTLRGDRMYEFLQRLILIAMPRIRDFKPLSPKSFDGRGNFAMGLKEQQVFPEISYDRVTDVFGMDIVIATTANSDKEALALLKAFGVPFKE